MNMKKFTVVGLMLVLAAGGAFAATSGTLNLVGTVPGILEISVSAESVAGNLDLTTDQTDLLVATINERSNKKAGYTVTLESQTAAAGDGSTSVFASADTGNPDTLTYTMSYGGSAVNLSGGSALVTDVTDKSNASGTNNELRISYTGSGEWLFEDTYEDTLTFTITAK